MCVKIKTEDEPMTAKDYAVVVAVIALNYAIVITFKLICI